MVDYFIKQIYDYKSKYIFNLDLTLENQEELLYQTQKEFEKALLLTSKNIFKVEIPKKKAKITYKITKGKREGQFFMRVSLDKNDGLHTGNKLKMVIESTSVDLDPRLTSPDHTYSLRKKSQLIELEVFKLGLNNVINGSKRSMASVTAASSSVSSTGSVGLGIALNIFSNDGDGTFLVFNQFLTTIKRIKLIGGFFGGSLEKFLELATGEKGQEEDSEERLRLRRRTLEVSIAENDKDKLKQESNGSHRKIDYYQQSVFFEGIFMIKILAYDVSWVVKIIGVLLMSQMLKIGKVVEWKLKFLRYQKKAHHAAMMITAMDTFFFGTRIILHRRNTLVGLMVKILLLINMSLMVIDFIEVIEVSMKLKSIKAQEFWLNNQSKEKRVPRQNSRRQARGQISDHDSVDFVLNQLSENRNLRTRNPRHLRSIVDKKLIIDHKKTLFYNQRNMAIENFCSSILVNSSESYDSIFMVLNSFLDVIQMALLQIFVVALPLSTRILLFLLIVMEIVFIMMTIVPFVFKYRFISMLDFVAKVVKFICMETFYVVLFIITLSSGQERRPVSPFLEDFGILVISTGITTTYLFTILKIIKLIVKAVKKFKEKFKEKFKDNKLIQKNKGSSLIFYSLKIEKKYEDESNQINSGNGERPIHFSRKKNHNKKSGGKKKKSSKNKKVPGRRTSPKISDGFHQASRNATFSRQEKKEGINQLASHLFEEKEYVRSSKNQKRCRVHQDFGDYSEENVNQQNPSRSRQKHPNDERSKRRSHEGKQGRSRHFRDLDARRRMFEANKRRRRKKRKKYPKEGNKKETPRYF